MTTAPPDLSKLSLFSRYKQICIFTQQHEIRKKNSHKQKADKELRDSYELPNRKVLWKDLKAKLSSLRSFKG